MSGYLVDTNVISEFTRPQPDGRVIRWLQNTDPESLFVSVVTFGEIGLGMEDLPPSRRSLVRIPPGAPISLKIQKLKWLKNHRGDC